MYNQQRAGGQRPRLPFEELFQLNGYDKPFPRDPEVVAGLERDGMIPGAFHAPRGMLEFWVDPESPYHKPMWADERKHFVLFCGAGWRSAALAG